MKIFIIKFLLFIKDLNSTFRILYKTRVYFNVCYIFEEFYIYKRILKVSLKIDVIKILYFYY